MIDSERRGRLLIKIGIALRTPGDPKNKWEQVGKGRKFSSGSVKEQAAKGRTGPALHITPGSPYRPQLNPLPKGN